MIKRRRRFELRDFSSEQLEIRRLLSADGVEADMNDDGFEAEEDSEYESDDEEQDDSDYDDEEQDDQDDSDYNDDDDDDDRDDDDSFAVQSSGLESGDDDTQIDATFATFAESVSGFDDSEVTSQLSATDDNDEISPSDDTAETGEVSDVESGQSEDSADNLNSNATQAAGEQATESADSADSAGAIAVSPVGDAIPDGEDRHASEDSVSQPGQQSSVDPGTVSGITESADDIDSETIESLAIANSKTRVAEDTQAAATTHDFLGLEFTDAVQLTGGPLIALANTVGGNSYSAALLLTPSVLPLSVAHFTAACAPDAAMLTSVSTSVSTSLKLSIPIALTVVVTCFGIREHRRIKRRALIHAH